MVSLPGIHYLIYHKYRQIFLHTPVFILLAVSFWPLAISQKQTRIGQNLAFKSIKGNQSQFFLLSTAGKEKADCYKIHTFLF
jgi:hypothetical protein